MANKWQQDNILKQRQIKNAIIDVRKAGMTLNKEKLIAECCMEWGMSRRTVREMVDMVLLTL